MSLLKKSKAEAAPEDDAEPAEVPKRKATPEPNLQILLLRRNQRRILLRMLPNEGLLYG